MERAVVCMCVYKAKTTIIVDKIYIQYHPIYLFAKKNCHRMMCICEEILKLKICNCIRMHFEPCKRFEILIIKSKNERE